MRIAGVNVGKVTDVQRDGDAASVTFSVDDEGQPIHEDASVDIRPRLFLEGNFFLDLDPGSPSSPELADGDTIPVTQTATAVQIDEVLAALQAPARKGLQRALSGLRHGAHLRADRGRRPRPGPRRPGQDRAPRRCSRRSATAARPGATPRSSTRRCSGQGPHDLSGLIAAQRQVFGKLEGHETQLRDLITNFNVFTGALAAESTNLSETIRELAPTVEQARPSLAGALRRAAAVPRAGDRADPGHRRSCRRRSGPRTRGSTRPSRWSRRPSSAGWSTSCKQSTPPLAQVTVASKGLFESSESFSKCVTHNLVPTGDIVIDDDDGTYPFGQGAPGFPSGITNFQEFLSVLVNQTGAGQGFDGNGTYLRANTGGGDVLGSTPYPPGGFRNTTVFGNNQGDVPGHAADVHADDAAVPHRRAPARTNPLPDVNGAGGAGLPGDVGPPQPATVAP